jgi:hypothetical protein
MRQPLLLTMMMTRQQQQIQQQQVMKQQQQMEVLLGRGQLQTIQSFNECRRFIVVATSQACGAHGEFEVRR